MTSLTMYSEWIAPTMLESMWTKPETKRTKVAHQVSGWVRVVDHGAGVLPRGGHGRCRLRPWYGRLPRTPIRRTLDDHGDHVEPDRGWIRDRSGPLAQTGRALCPALVQPPPTIATNAAEMHGATAV